MHQDQYRRFRIACQGDFALIVSTQRHGSFARAGSWPEQ